MLSYTSCFFMTNQTHVLSAVCFVCNAVLAMPTSTKLTSVIYGNPCKLQSCGTPFTAGVREMSQPLTIDPHLHADLSWSSIAQDRFCHCHTAHAKQIAMGAPPSQGACWTLASFLYWWTFSAVAADGCWGGSFPGSNASAAFAGGGGCCCCCCWAASLTGGVVTLDFATSSLAEMAVCRPARKRRIAQYALS